MTGGHSHTALLVDPDVRSVGIDPKALVMVLRSLELGRTMLVPGIARHPELLTGATKACGATRAVVVAADFGRAPVAELRTWGAAGGLLPLGVQAVALDMLGAGRSATERSAYTVRLVRAAVVALDEAATAAVGRRAVGASLSRRALLSCRSNTWVPVIGVGGSACLGSLRCSRCIEACPEDALLVQDVFLDGPPEVDASRCQACSRCLDVCPTKALSLDGHDPGILARRLWALLPGDDDAAPPALIIACQHAADPVHRLGARRGLPGWLMLELTCLGGVGSAWYLAALAAGARSVHLLPCAQCRDSAALSTAIRFTQSLLAGLGDFHAGFRVGILPPGGLPLRRALLAAGGLAALADRTGADRAPPPATKSPAHVAAWAVGELLAARLTSTPDWHERSIVVDGVGSPLGVPRAAGGCTACGVCVRICPTGALSLASGHGITEVFLDPAACTGCEVCAGACPEGVLDVVARVDVDLLARGCLPIARVTASTCPDCGETVPVLPTTAHLSSLTAGLVGRCPRCRQSVLAASV